MDSGSTALLREQHSAYRNASRSCSASELAEYRRNVPSRSHGDQVLVLQFLEVVREGGAGDAELFADVADDQPVRVRGQQQAHDPQPRLRCPWPTSCRRIWSPIGTAVLFISIILQPSKYMVKKKKGRKGRSKIDHNTARWASL